MSETLPNRFEFAIGCRVRVISGPFAGVEGTVRTKRCTCRSELSLDLVQSGISLEIDDCQLQAIQMNAQLPAPLSELSR